ncbi:unnamed protein product [Didymodactylos carnosus]|uniref:Uncharacterized protein n=1 Tax=Didymodactylos carnosus TaxID=1234261 RepID=A0A814Q263_9BILA|nr:unnamed protein product [Didymodactylos carnosus]CAF3877628.1 unnamed protein product [Didymodactylos carnosus]
MEVVLLLYLLVLMPHTSQQSGTTTITASTTRSGITTSRQPTTASTSTARAPTSRSSTTTTTKVTSTTRSIPTTTKSTTTASTPSSAPMTITTTTTTTDSTTTTSTTSQAYTPVATTVTYADCTINGSNLVTFDDVSNCTECLIPNGYMNLKWTNVGVVDPSKESSNYLTSGYETALTSGSYTTFNDDGSPMTISASDSNQPFTLGSFIAASAWYDNNILTITSSRSGMAMYTATYSLLVNTAMVIQLNWSNLDSVTFSTSNWQFAMDNLCLGISNISGYVSPDSSTVPQTNVNDTIYWASGPQTDLDPLNLTGWSVCYQDTYDVDLYLTLNTALLQCYKNKLMMSCRPISSSLLTLAAMGLRSDVLYDCGTNESCTHVAHGVGWYFSSSFSWGFVDGTDSVYRGQCDTTSYNSDLRLCWHTGNWGVGGYRCGATTGLNINNGWERLIWHAD